MKHACLRRAQRGVTLIEALIAFTVMAFGMLAVLGLQTTLRFNGDVAKQRSEATRLAQEEMERLRAFTVLPTSGTERAYDDLASVPTTTIAGFTTNASYDQTVTVNKLTGPDRADVTIAVGWTDRQGGSQSVVLNSVITGIDPALSGGLSVPPHGAPVRQPLGRHPGIPFDAKNLGDGRSVFKPEGSTGTVAWVFDNKSGVVTSRCIVIAGTTTSSLTAGDLSGCTVVVGRLVSGVVRFAFDDTMTAAVAESPNGDAMDLEMTIALDTTIPGVTYTLPPFECFDNSPAVPSPTQKFVRYACLVFPSTDQMKWTGALNIIPVGWSVGNGSSQFRVCRYTGDYDGRDGITNLEHPATYSSVEGGLTNQNFLVIKAQSSGQLNCPTDVAADPAQGDFVNSNTREQQPNPAS